MPPYPSAGPASEPPPGSVPTSPQYGYSTPDLPQPGLDPLISVDYSGWWQRGMAIVKAGWPQLAALQVIGIGVALLVQVPFVVYVTVWGPALADRYDTPADADLGPASVALGLTLLGILLSGLVSAAITVATMHLGLSIASGATRRVGASARYALRRTLPMVGWQVVAALIVLLGLCLCLLPALYPIAVFTILPAVVAFERSNAIGRCFSLFNRSVDVAAGRIATILGISVVTSLVASIIGGVIERAAGAPTSLGMPIDVAAVSTSVQIAVGIATTAVSVVLAAAVAVLTGPLILLTYADLRARVEPLSTQVLVSELERLRLS